MEGGDEVVSQEEDAAAAEAGEIGGPAPEYEGDEEERPVAEGGGGESEGFEQAEQELVERAENLDEHRSPRRDSFTEEQEADKSTAAYGEPDQAQPPDA